MMGKKWCPRRSIATPIVMAVNMLICSESRWRDGPQGMEDDLPTIERIDWKEVDQPPEDADEHKVLGHDADGHIRNEPAHQNRQDD